MMRRLLAAVCVLAVAVTAGVIAPASLAEDESESAPVAATTTTTTTRKKTDLGRFLLGDIARYRKQVWRLEALMRMPRSHSSRRAEKSNDAHVRRAVLAMWKKKAALRKRQAQNPPRMNAWLCINRFEAPWNDPQPPYYGGLQMDLSFQQTYAPELVRSKGTADRWTAIEQIWVAERAYRSGRGFTPWPNTARFCGLI